MRNVMSERQRQPGRGLTLIEVLLSLLLLSFVVLGSISLLTVASRQTKLAKNRSIATSLAAERLDHLTSLTYHAADDYGDYGIPGETGAAGPPATLTANYGDITGFPEFRRRVTLTYDSPTAGLMAAKVEVFWQDQQQGEKQHTLLTFVHRELERR